MSTWVLDLGKGPFIDKNLVPQEPTDTHSTSGIMDGRRVFIH